MRLRYATRALSLTSALSLALAASGCDKLLPESASTNPALALEQGSDAQVTAAIETALGSDENLRQLDISVVTRKGDVRLSGTVNSPAQHTQITDLARHITGVHSIHDELTPQP